MVVFKMRKSVPTPRYSPVCNVLRQWKTSLILTYRVYLLYDILWRQYSVIVGAMFMPSIFDDRCVDFRKSMCQLSKIDVSTFEDRRLMCRPSKIDDRCVDFRRSVCRPEIDVSTFENRGLMCRSSKIDVSTFEHRWSM